MQRAGQRRLPAGGFFEDGLSSPLIQVTFPPRRHSSKDERTTSLIPATRRIQQTLTQLIPAFAHASSSNASFDGVNDLEYDSLTPVMPLKKKPRKSNKKITPVVQAQTITQMDPFKEQLYSKGGPEELEKENSLTVCTPLPRTRRRKSSHTPIVSTIQTRSSRKKAVKADIDNEAAETPIPCRSSTSHTDQGANTSIPASQDVQMPPPTTPKRTKRKVVPSSQSPADTPFSTHSKRHGKDGRLNYTPLRELSTNTPSRARKSSRRKTVQWAPKLEIADSTNIDTENSEDPFPLVIQPISVKNKTEQPRSLVAKISLKPLMPTPPSDHLLPPYEGYTTAPCVSSQGSIAGTLNARTLTRKRTVADSEDEDNSSLTRSPEERLNSRTGNSNLTLAPMVKNDSTSPLPLPNRNGEDPTQSGSPRHEDVPQDDSFETVPTQLVDLQGRLASPVLEHTPRSVKPQFPTHRTDSDEASAQLRSELHLSSSPASALQTTAPALETESQFENAWRDFTPPSPILEDDDEPELETVEQPTLPTFEGPRQVDPPTELLPLPPVPPSQATTTDITQATPHHTRLADNDSQLLGSSPPLQRIQTLSSSSPFQARREPAATTFMGYQGWNGVPLTDSQLLPHSLLNDSLQLPPMFRDEEGMEMEEE